MRSTATISGSHGDRLRSEGAGARSSRAAGARGRSVHVFVRGRIRFPDQYPKDDPRLIEEDDRAPPQSIYVCPTSRTLNNDAFAYSMIHELAHFTSPFSAAGNHDFAYFHRDPAKYKSLDTDQAFHNADCYSQFAFDAIGKPDFNIEVNRNS